MNWEDVEEIDVISFKVIAQNLSHGTAFCWRNSKHKEE
jgi:hypothetical protein